MRGATGSESAGARSPRDEWCSHETSTPVASSIWAWESVTRDNEHEKQMRVLSLTINDGRHRRDEW